MLSYYKIFSYHRFYNNCFFLLLGCLRNILIKIATNFQNIFCRAKKDTEMTKHHIPLVVGFAENLSFFKKACTRFIEISVTLVAFQTGCVPAHVGVYFHYVLVCDGCVTAQTNRSGCLFSCLVHTVHVFCICTAKLNLNYL